MIRFAFSSVFVVILAFATAITTCAQEADSDISDAVSDAATDEAADAVSETMEAAHQALRNQEHDIAHDLFYSLAEQGNAPAQFEIGALYHRGAGVEPDVARAARWYANAAELGHIEAQYRLGNMYMMGEGVPQSDTEAIHWYEKAAQQGHKDAGDNLASLRRISTAKTRQELEQEAASLPPLKVEKRTPTGDKVEQPGFFKRWFGGDKKNEPVAEPPAQAPAILQTPTTQGSTTRASTTQGPGPDPAETEKPGFFARLFGKDKEQDREPGESMPAAGSGNETPAPAAQNDVERPTPLANSGAVSNYELGMAYALGNTLDQDNAKAFEHFTMAAQEGYAPAQYRLGVAYADGEGTVKDPTRAVEWYEKSAVQGHAAAQRSLALIYLNGLEDVAPDKPLALAWYNLLAQDGNNPMDVHRRDILLKELSQQEISAAQEMTAELRGSITAAKNKGKN